MVCSVWRALLMFWRAEERVKPIGGINSAERGEKKIKQRKMEEETPVGWRRKTSRMERGGGDTMW